MLGPIVLAILVTHSFTSVPLPSQAPATQQATSTQTAAEKPWPPRGVVRPGGGVVAPKLVKEVKPNYSPAAMRAGVEGTVGMEAVIEADGTVGEVRVTRSLDREFGLDDEAVRTVKQWQFEAGKKDGVAVPVLVEIQMAFTLRK